MNISKNTIIAIAMVAVLAVAGVAVAISLNQSETVGVTYYGNGGQTSQGEDKAVYSNETAIDGNIFQYEHHSFIGWNTKADATGTGYEVGSPVSSGTILYAQWVCSYHVTSFSAFGANPGFSLSINEFPLYAYSLFASPAVIKIAGGSDWTLLGDDSFVGSIDGRTYTVTLTVTGCQGTPIYEVYEGTPMIGFQTVDDVGISITYRAL